MTHTASDQITVAERIRYLARKRPCTLLGVGVVSQVVVDAALEIANVHHVDLMLVASRRQVETDSAGGGYVASWNACRFAEYVRERDLGKRILLCRDHGGPWQGPFENTGKLTANEAMLSAKDSYQEDIEAGFHVLHIDTSRGPASPTAQRDGADRLEELYLHCADAARSLGRDIALEVGTDEQVEEPQTADALLAALEPIRAFCRRERVQPPSFIVAQTGTKVVEMSNVGKMNRSNRPENWEGIVTDLLAAIKPLGVFLKQHNTDYLPDEILARHPALGIHGANVAPEFGVAESLALIEILEATGLASHRDRFLELAFESNHWQKWMSPHSRSSDREKAIIAGHYVFSSPAFLELKATMARDLKAHEIDLQNHLTRRVKAAILRYAYLFRLV